MIYIKTTKLIINTNEDDAIVFSVPVIKSIILFNMYFNGTNIINELIINITRSY